VRRVDVRVERRAELRHERGLQAVDRLALRGRDCGQRLAGLELRLELRVGEAEVLRSSVLEPGAVTVIAGTGRQPGTCNLRGDPGLGGREDLRFRGRS